MWEISFESEVKCKPLKTAGQLEKYLSPTSPNSHVKMCPTARKADGLTIPLH